MASRPMDGYLFTVPAKGLDEQRRERRHTIRERCERAAELVQTGKPAIVWCHLNQEGDLLEELIPDCVQVSGDDSDDAKEEKLKAFSRGQVRVMITKPKIAGFGLNWQHCSHMVLFPSHSYEQYYQSVRRCWRFGQTRPVTVDIVTTEGESDVMQNLQRKTAATEKMFAMIVEHMREELAIQRRETINPRLEVPQWVRSIKN
jgi:superfamily II DNA or RNA helicase